MVCKYGNLTVKETPANLYIDNGRVLLRLFLRDGGYAQEFYAIDQSGKFHAVLSSLHKNLIMATEHRVTSSPMIAGERPHLFGINRESLRMVYDQAQIVEHSEAQVVVRLSGTVQDHGLKCYMTIQEGADHVHVSVEDEISNDDGPPLVEYLMDSYAFLPGTVPIGSSKPLDFTWAPVIRPKKDHVIGDCSFGSPAAIVQQGTLAAAIVPDLNVLSEHRPMSAALDLDLKNGLLFAPLISYGFCGYENIGDFCRHDVTMSRRLYPPRLKYGYDLILSATCKKKSAHRDVGRFLWRKYGATAVRQHAPNPHHLAEKQPIASLEMDTHTGMTYQSGWDMLKLANSCLDKFASLGAKRDLDAGLKYLDHLCMLQSVHGLPWMENPPPPGMMAASNLGGHFDAALTAEFGRCALRFGALTGDSYYFERGTAAMRAALCVTGASEKTMATIRTCANEVRAEFGTIYIHVGKRWGACTADSRIRRLEFTDEGVSLSLMPHPGPNGHRKIVFGGMRRKSYKIRIDGQQKSFSKEEMAEGLTVGG